MSTVRIKDADLRQVESALRRAGQQARRTAAATHTPVVVYKNGKVIRQAVRAGTAPSAVAPSRAVGVAGKK